MKKLNLLFIAVLISWASYSQCIITAYVTTTNSSGNGNADGSATIMVDTGAVAPYTYLWSNGESSATITGLVAGTYCYTVTDANGCVTDDTLCAYIYEDSPGCGLYVSLALDSTPCSGPLHSLGALINGGTAPFAYAWSTGDSGQFLCDLSASGNYCVTVTDAGGCTASGCYNFLPDTSNSGTPDNDICSDAVILNPAGSCNFISGTNAGATESLPPAICSGYTANTAIDVWYQFTASQSSQTIKVEGLSGGSFDPVIEIFANGCGALSSLSCTDQGGQTEVLSMNNLIAGNTYLVRVYDYYGNGGNFQICITEPDTTINTDCSVIFSSSPDSILCLTPSCPVAFYAYPSGTAPFTYNWTFSDGTTDTLENPQHTFNATNGGDYACLEVTDANGCVSSYCDYVYTYDDSGNVAGCNAGFSGYFDDTSGTSGEVFFQDYSYSSSGQVTSWSWDFGDGSTSALQNPSHVFATAGNYTICLTISSLDANNTSCTSTYCETWYIDPAWWSNNPWGNGSGCDANFTASQDSSVSGMVYLVDLSYGNNLFYTWNFVSSDGSVNQTVNTPNPFINFTQFGCFGVTLTITDTLTGCTDVHTDSICVDSLGNLSGKASNWGLAVISSPMPESVLLSSREVMNSETSVSLFPNPAQNGVTIKFNTPQAEIVQVQLFDITGKAALSEKIKVSAGSNNHRMELSTIPDGVYFVRINSANINYAEKIVKLN